MSMDCRDNSGFPARDVLRGAETDPSGYYSSLRANHQRDSDDGTGDAVDRLTAGRLQQPEDDDDDDDASDVRSLQSRKAMNPLNCSTFFCPCCCVSAARNGQKRGDGGTQVTQGRTTDPRTKSTSQYPPEDSHSHTVATVTTTEDSVPGIKHCSSVLT